MAWIEHPADGELVGPQWAAARDPATGRVDHVLAVHAQHPAGLAAHLALYGAVMRGTEGLPQVDRELVAFVVSDLNGCRY